MPPRVAGVLGRHVDVVVPEVAHAAPAVGVPGGILLGKLDVVGDERPVLDDQRDLVGGDGLSTRAVPSRCRR